MHSISLIQVRRLQAESVTSHSWSGLIGSLPGLKEIGEIRSYKCISLTNPDADIAQISLGLRNTGASLTHIWLSGLIAHAHHRVVSEASLRSLCDVIIDRAVWLEEIKLSHLTIGEKSLVRLVETCRAITTMVNIK